jgi:hypothetical protein
VAEQTDLERRLSRLGANLAWPESPDLRAPVRHAILARRPWFQTRWALAAVAVIAILSVLLAYTPTRTAIADFLNLHTTITHTTTLPTPSPLPPGPLGQRLGLGGQTTLAAAQSGVTWHVLVPASLGNPDEVYLQTTDAPTLGEVTLVYGSRPGMAVSGQTGVSVLVTEARGQVNEQFFGKIIGNGTTIEDVTVNGHRGWWISGSPHEFFFTDASGEVRAETLRLATNTLIVDMGGTIVRIEGDLTRDQALAIAASLAG